MIGEVLSIKLKLLVRNRYKFNLKSLSKINYLLIFVPFYCYLINNLYLFNNFFYGLLICCLVCLGLDFHTVLNKSHLSSKLIFNYLLNNRKSIEISLVTDLIIKYVIFLPILLIISNKLLLFVTLLFFLIKSFLLKEIVSSDLANNKVYYIFLIFYLMFFTFFGGVFLESTQKSINIIEYCNTHFYTVLGFFTLINIILSGVFSSIYFKA